VPPRAVAAHEAEIAMPEPGSGQVEDLPRLDPAHEILEGAFDRTRICALAGQPGGFLEQMLIKHKICAFHVFIVPRPLTAFAAGHSHDCFGMTRPIFSNHMTLDERISRDITAAMKAQDAARLSALRMAKAALKNKEIDKRAPLDEGEVVKVLQTLVRQREDSIEQFTRGNRADLAAKERAEIEVLKGYLPAEVGEETIQAAVEQAVAETGAASPRDVGRVMKAAMARLQSAGAAVDGRKVNEAVRKRLGG
jgi:uncharacterized protein